MARGDGVDVDDASEALGCGLHDCASDGAWRCRARHTRRQKKHGHAAADAGFHDLTGFGCEFHWRDNEAVRVAQEGARAPVAFATCYHVQHF